MFPQSSGGGTKKTLESTTPTRCPATRSSRGCPLTMRRWSAWGEATTTVARRPSATTSRRRRRPSPPACPWYASATRRRRSPTPSSVWCRTACSCTTTGAVTACPSRSCWRLTTCDRPVRPPPPTPPPLPTTPPSTLNTPRNPSRPPRRRPVCNNLLF